MTDQPWRTRRTIVTESTDPDGKTLVATDDVTYAGDHLMVPAVDEAATEMRDARARFFALIDAAAAVCGGEVARDIEDAAIDVEAALRVEAVARMLNVAMALESHCGIFVATPAGEAAAATCPSPLPEWPPVRVMRYRGRRVLAAMAGAFVAGLAVRSVMGRVVFVVATMLTSCAWRSRPKLRRGETPRHLSYV